MDLNREIESDINFDEELYNIEWSDIENAEIDYENYLNDIESFFTDYYEDDEEEGEDDGE